ncbi:MAG: GAF domain-containing protein [Candidatus Methanoperedens sp.]|nr:GAF domain-containing protein [Candidatus Methanoperedens sp.]
MKRNSVIYKISLLVLIIVLIPLVIMSSYILSDFPVLKKQINNATDSLQYESNQSFQKVKEIAIKNSEDTLDTQSDKLIRIRLIEISKQISEFLRGVQDDAIFLSTLPQDERTYLNFMNSRRKAVWFNTDNYEMLPVYSEISFIGTDGMERVKIKNGSISKDLLDLSKDAFLEFKSQAAPDAPVTNYYKEGMKLKNGEIYVSHIEGRILNITQAHAGNRNPYGKYAHGIQRFVTPVYRDGEKIGILMLGLDSIHVLEYMQHIRPLDYDRLPLTDLLSGDYLALLDNEGWLLHPKQYFSKGYDKNGELVPPVNESNFQEYNASGLFPMHIPSSKILWGKSGDEYMKRIMNSLYVTGEGDFFNEQMLEGKTKVAVWVPVTYGREYGDKSVNMERGYGFLFASSELPVFYQSSIDMGKLIGNQSEILANNLKEVTVLATGNIDETARHILNRIPFILMLIMVMLIGFGLAGTYMIIRPLRSVTEGARTLGEGKLEHRIDVTSEDEMGELASSFNIMASELSDKAASMRKNTRELSALYAVAKSVSQSLDIDEMLNSTLLNVLQVMGAEGGAINLAEEDGTILHLKVHKGLSQKFVDAVKKIKMDFGVSGQALKMKKPVAIDISRYPEESLIPLLREGGIVSIASTPILFKDRILGTINIHYMHPHILSQDELDLFASIGNELGVAVENLNLFAEIQRHDRTLEALYTIESVVSRSLNLEEIFDTALLKALEVTDTEAGTLYSVEGDILRLVACEGLCPEFKKKAVIRNMGDGIPGMAAQLKKALTMDISEFPSPPLLPYITKEGLVSFIGTPLLSKGKVVGALALGTKKKRIFTQDDLDLLFSIGNVIGIAVENARLYSESKENLEKLQKTYEELKTLDRMKDEFMSNVSHELKTPLISIKGYSELLYDEKLGGRLDEQKKSLEAIIRNADRLTRLINSILFITRFQSGKIEFRSKSIDIDEIMQISIEDLKNPMDKKQITFEKELSAVSRLRGDKDRFVEVITNLLDNAIKFTPVGGKITLKALDEGENVHITISDNGIGIPADIIPKLFTRFYQVDASTSRKYGGTGLGLYITKTIIDATGGKIWIESEVQKGTTVHILIPAAKAES